MLRRWCIVPSFIALQALSQCGTALDGAAWKEMVDAELTDSVVQEWGLKYTVLDPLPNTPDTAWRLPPGHDDKNLIAFHRNGRVKFRQTTKHDWQEEVHFDTSGVIESYRFVSKGAGMRHERRVDHGTDQLTERTVHWIQQPAERDQTKRLPHSLLLRGNKLFARHEMVLSYNSLGTLVSNYVSNDTAEYAYTEDRDTLYFSHTIRAMYEDERNTTIHKRNGVRIILSLEETGTDRPTYVLQVDDQIVRSGNAGPGLLSPGLLGVAGELIRKYRCGDL